MKPRPWSLVTVTREGVTTMSEHELFMDVKVWQSKPGYRGCHRMAPWYVRLAAWLTLPWINR